jgi:hypothetical protein
VPPACPHAGPGLAFRRAVHRLRSPGSLLGSPGSPLRRLPPHCPEVSSQLRRAFRSPVSDGVVTNSAEAGSPLPARSFGALHSAHQTRSVPASSPRSVGHPRGESRARTRDLVPAMHFLTFTDAATPHRGVTPSGS